MPLTFFHLGPALLVAFLALDYLDLPTLLLATVLVDVRAALVVFEFWPGPRHLWVHSALGGVVVAAVAVVLVWPVRERLGDALGAADLAQPAGRRSVVAGALAGAWLHVATDALHHPLMVPFWPAAGNPLLVTTTRPMRLVTFACLLGAMALYAAHALDARPLSRARNK